MLVSSHQLRENLKTVVISRLEQLPLWVEIMHGNVLHSAFVNYRERYTVVVRSVPHLLGLGVYVFSGPQLQFGGTLSEPLPPSMGCLLAGLLPLLSVWGGLTACPTRPCSLGAGATNHVRLPFLLHPHLQVDRLVHVCGLFSASHSVSLPCQCHSGRNP